jgi:hypothetical protein
VRRASRRLVPAAVEFGTFLEREAAALINAEGNLMEILGAGARGRPGAAAKPRGAKRRRGAAMKTPGRGRASGSAKRGAG